jgi:hypothetical protein
VEIREDDGSDAGLDQARIDEDGQHGAHALDPRGRGLAVHALQWAET